MMTIDIDKFTDIRTPFYYYDLGLLHSTLKTMKAVAGDDYVIHYAIKANANPTILKIISAYGLGADCVSGGEIKVAIENGFNADKIVFAGVGKSDWEIVYALQHDIECFNVESIEEMRVIAEIADKLEKKANICLRINPNVAAHTHANITTGLAENKFGISISDVESVIEECFSLKSLRFKGFHFHIGSQILDMADFIVLCNRVNQMLQWAEKHHVRIEIVNVGGGLGIEYHNPDSRPIPDFDSYFSTFRSHIKLFPYQTLHFELGRAVVGQCGSLITRCLYVKHGHHKQFAIIDGSMTELIRPALYQAYHAIENLSNTEGREYYDVVGPVCESSDVFAKNIELPTTHRGDIIAIRSAGAYGESMASCYNSRPLPQSIFSDEIE